MKNINNIIKVFDITRLVSRHWEGNVATGVDRVNLMYIDRYRKNAMAVIRHWGHWLFLTEEDSQQLFDILCNKKKCKIKIFLMVLKTHFFNQKYIKNSLFFNLVHSGLEKKSYLKYIARENIKVCYFLHDLIPIFYPEYNRPFEDLKHHKRLKTMLKKESLIILNSEDTHSALLFYVNRYQLSTPNIMVSLLGVDLNSKKKKERPIIDPYFVILGTIEPRKNHLLLLNIWRRMVSEKLTVIPKLVVIGKRGWECEQVVDMLDRCTAIKEHIIELNHCDDETVSNYLFYSQALLFPTFVEGYGLPLVEALSLGVPVISSNLSVFREIAGDIPEYLDPIDGIGWYHTITHYMNNDSLQRKNQLERLKQYNPWTWDDHFKIVDSFIENKILK